MATSNLRRYRAALRSLPDEGKKMPVAVVRCGRDMRPREAAQATLFALRPIVSAKVESLGQSKRERR